MLKSQQNSEVSKTKFLEMDIEYLQSKIKPIGKTYTHWFLFGSHYAYLGKWNIQVLYWLTLGGIGIWAIADFFRMTEIIIKQRESVFEQIEKQILKEKLTQGIQNKTIPATRYKLAMVG